jgi:hypothetical protein
MVSRKQEKLFSFVGGHYSSTVSNIGNITLIWDHEYDYSTWAWPIMSRLFFICYFTKFTLGCETSWSQSLSRIFRKSRVIDY